MTHFKRTKKQKITIIQEKKWARRQIQQKTNINFLQPNRGIQTKNNGPWHRKMNSPPQHKPTALILKQLYFLNLQSLPLHVRLLCKKLERIRATSHSNKLERIRVVFEHSIRRIEKTDSVNLTNGVRSSPDHSLRIRRTKQPWPIKLDFFWILADHNYNFESEALWNK